MPMLVAGLLLLWLSSILLRGFTRANPAAMARIVRKGGGSVALLFAAMLVVRGEINLAVLAAGAGLWLLGSQTPVAAAGGHPGSSGFAGRYRTRDPSLVRIRTDGLDVVVDRTTGTAYGAVTAGPNAGRRLETLSEPEVAASHRWSLTGDPEGARVLEAYLDSRFPGWRETDQVGDDPRGAQAGGRSRRTVRMPDHEAYHVLGLAEGASREEITRAHRQLMKKYHPDHGGSTAMAARVNEAKDVLMRRHP